MDNKKPLGLFPADLNFDRTRTHLQYSVDCLPETKGRTRRQKSQLQALKKKLLQLSVKDLKKLKMKPALQKDLLYLVTEPNNPALQNRLVAVTLGCLSTIQMTVLRNLLPYLWENMDLRKAVYRKFSTDPPDEKQPRWLRVYWKKLLGPEDMIEGFVAILQQEKIQIPKALSFLELPPGTPLAETVLERYWEAMSDSQLIDHQFADCLWFIEKSGHSLRVRYGLLQWFLGKYGTQVKRLNDVNNGTAIRAIFDLAVTFWGKPPLGRWYDLPPDVCRVGNWLWARQQLEHWMKGSQRKLHWWSRWVTTISDVGVHQATGIIVIELENHFAIESFHQPNELHLIDVDAFAETWRVHRFQKQPLQLPPFEQTLTRTKTDWPQIFDEVLIAKGIGKPEEWKW